MSPVADYLFDLSGLVVGLLMLAGSVVYIRLIKHDRLSLPWPFILFGAVTLVQTALMPMATLTRLLSFSGLCGAFIFFAALGKNWRTGFFLHLLAIIFIGFILADAFLSLGRPMTINPNKAAAMLLLLFPFGVNWLVLPAILATGSRAAIIGMAVAGLVIVWGVLDRLERVVIIGELIGVAVLLILARPGTITARFEHWSKAVGLFASSPFIGLGPGAYVRINPGEAHADSAPLTLLSEQGLIGAIAALPLLGWIVTHFKRTGLYAVPLLALAVQNLADDTWGWPWICLGLGFNLALLYRHTQFVEGGMLPQ